MRVFLRLQFGFESRGVIFANLRGQDRGPWVIIGRTATEPSGVTQIKQKVRAETLTSASENYRHDVSTRDVVPVLEF